MQNRYALHFGCSRFRGRSREQYGIVEQNGDHGDSGVLVVSCNVLATYFQNLKEKGQLINWKASNKIDLILTVSALLLSSWWNASNLNRLAKNRYDIVKLAASVEPSAACITAEIFDGCFSCWAASEYNTNNRLNKKGE
jgi:hypothetical protein